MTRPVGIVFGGSKGIGAATAKILASDGVIVIIAARNADGCKKVAEEIQISGDTAIAMRADVTDRDQVNDIVQAAMERFGRIDYVINCAGTMDPIGRTEICDSEMWGKCLDINLLGSVHTSQAALPVFRSQNSGVIVNLSSGAAFHALEGWGAYCVAKAGLAMLTKVLATELAGTNVLIYGFQPGMVNTGMTREALKHKVNRVAELDYNSFDLPEAPAAAIAWLCAHQPQSLSGQEVVFNDPDVQQMLSSKMYVESSEYRS